MSQVKIYSYKGGRYSDSYGSADTDLDDCIIGDLQDMMNAIEEDRSSLDGNDCWHVDITLEEVR